MAPLHIQLANSMLRRVVKRRLCPMELVEQDHWAIKRRTRPKMGFKVFWSAVEIIAGAETLHMIKKGQLGCRDGLDHSAADDFYSLDAA
jgi:transposase-like protein